MPRRNASKGSKHEGASAGHRWTAPTGRGLSREAVGRLASVLGTDGANRRRQGKAEAE